MSVVQFAPDSKLVEAEIGGVIMRWRRIAATLSTPLYALFAGGCPYGEGRPWIGIAVDPEPRAFARELLADDPEEADAIMLVATLCGVEWKSCEDDPVTVVRRSLMVPGMLQDAILGMGLVEAAELREHMVGNEDPRALALLLAHTWATAYDHVGTTRP